MMRLRSERGVVAPLVAVMLIGLVALVGLVVDAGVLLAARRDMQMLADGASRAAAMQIDIPNLRAFNRVRLDTTGASQAARSYLAAQGYTGTVYLQVMPTSVRVNLEQNRPTVMLSLVGVRTVLVTASVETRPLSGIERPE